MEVFVDISDVPGITYKNNIADMSNIDNYDNPNLVKYDIDVVSNNRYSVECDDIFVWSGLDMSDPAYIPFYNDEVFGPPRVHPPDGLLCRVFANTCYNVNPSVHIIEVFVYYTENRLFIRALDKRKNIIAVVRSRQAIIAKLLKWHTLLKLSLCRADNPVTKMINHACTINESTTKKTMICKLRHSMLYN